MKRLLVCLLLMVGMVGCEGNSSNGNKNSEAEAGTKKAEPADELTGSTPEEFAQSIVALLAGNDPNKFFEFVFPANEELLAVTLPFIPEDDREEFKKELDTRYAEGKLNVMASFGDVRNAVDAAVGDWKSVKVIADTYGPVTLRPYDVVSIDVVISGSNKIIWLELVGCYMVDGRCYTTGGMEYRADWEKTAQPALFPSRGKTVTATELTASTPEEFAQSVLALLAGNDPNKFFEFAFPAKEEQLAYNLKTSTRDRDGLAFVAKVTGDKFFGNWTKWGKGVLKSFAEFRNEQTEKGCDWKEAKFVRAEYARPSFPRNAEEHNGVLQTGIDVTFSTGGQTYEFGLPCMF